MRIRHWEGLGGGRIYPAEDEIWENVGKEDVRYGIPRNQGECENR